MKTYAAKQGDIERKWYLVDIKNQVLGRVATKIADLLRGKGKPLFSAHIDCGDHVIVVNAKYVKLTGKKLTDKLYIKHSKYPGGLKKKTARTLLEEKPEEIIKRAVFGMLPKNKLRKDMLGKLKIFADKEHKHEAQNPIKLEF